MLVLTGFALKFPDSWFASMLSLGEHMRHLLHRIAAVVLIGVSVYHIFDVAFTRRRTQAGPRSVPHAGRCARRMAECLLLSRSHFAQA